MSKVTGQIKAIARSGKAFMIEDKWYSDRFPIKGIERGDTVSFEFKVNGEWNNISSEITKTESARPAANSGGAGSGKGSVEINILASHSINCAVQLAVANGDTSVASLERYVKMIYQLNLSTREKIIAGELNKAEVTKTESNEDEENPFL